MFIVTRKWEISDNTTSISYDEFEDVMKSLERDFKESDSYRMTSKNGELVGWYDHNRAGMVEFTVSEIIRD